MSRGQVNTVGTVLAVDEVVTDLSNRTTQKNRPPVFYEEAMLRLEEIKAPKNGAVRYAYDAFGVLQSIEVGGYDSSGNNWTSHNTYVLTYDGWNRPEKTKVGTVTLSTNTYYDDGKLWKVNYSNGLLARYVYEACQGDGSLDNP